MYFFYLGEYYMASKFYAVAKGKKIGIFKTWKECEESVKNFKGASYKSFFSYDEALKFVENFEKKDFELNDIESDKNIKKFVEKDLLNEVVSIFVDGSYDKFKNKIGYGILIINDLDRNKWVLISEPISSSNYNKYKNHNNVTGEIFGTIKSISYCISHNFKKVRIYYDYEGIKKWATKEWSSKTPISILYSNYIDEIKRKYKDFEVNFQKVKSHSGIEYNDIADSLAKKSLSI